MGYFLAVITSLLALFFGYSLYVKKGTFVFNEKEKRDIQGRMSTLLTDFNRVSNSNINVLEEKIKDLREVVELADEKIQRLNGLMADLEIASSKVGEKRRILIKKEMDFTPKSLVTKEYERIHQLTSQEFASPGIVKEVGTNREEVQLVLNRGVH